MKVRHLIAQLLQVGSLETEVNIVAADTLTSDDALDFNISGDEDEVLIEIAAE